MDPNVTPNDPLDADTVEAIGLDATGRDGDPRFPYTEAALTHTEQARLARYHASGLGFTVIDLDRVVTLLRERHGIADAYVEQTGGGCATIYAAKLADNDPARGAVWTVAAGPGWFDGPAWTKARANLDDFYIGADGDDYVELGTVTRDDDEDTVAAKIAAAITARQAALGALLTRIRAVPGYDPATFLTDPGAEVELADDPDAPADDLLAAAAITVIRAETTGAATALAFDVAAAAATIVSAVGQDTATGIIPVTATTFADLHAAVDANDYLTAAGVPTDPETVAGVQHQVERRLAILSDNVRRLLRGAAPVTPGPDTAGKTLQVADGVLLSPSDHDQVAAALQSIRPLTQYAAVIEWQGTGFDPTVFVGPDLPALRRQLVTTLADRGKQLCEDDGQFIRDNPPPINSDDAAIEAWLVAFHEALTVPWWTTYQVRGTAEAIATDELP